MFHIGLVVLLCSRDAVVSLIRVHRPGGAGFIRRAMGRRKRLIASINPACRAENNTRNYTYFTAMVPRIPRSMCAGKVQTKS